MKKYVTINNKENTAYILLLNIFSTKSGFIVFDFTMKSIPIIVFYFRCRMLEDSLTFQLSSLASLKEKKWKLRSVKKKAISKMSINDVIRFNFYIVFVYNKNCEKQKFENKNCVFFYILLIYVNFYLNFQFPSITFQKQNRVTNSKHIWWLLT